MTATTEPVPPHRAPRSWSRTGWRLATPAAFALTGVLFVVSARDSDGTDLRPGRYEDLATLVQAESDQARSLRQQASALQRQVDALAGGVANSDVRRLRELAETRKAAAGFEPVTGPALRITLSDAPEEVINSSNQKLSRMVVHQQDIQAVVNALWQGGATGITVQGQRIITTTGIKCEGNAVQLDGIPYGQPYVIVAVGDLAQLADALNEDDYVQGYIEDAEQPDVAVGWNIEPLGSATLPGYAGLRQLTYAHVSG